MEGMEMSSPLSGPSILITGNMGYVGPGVVERLRLNHATVRLIGLDTGFFATNLLRGHPLPERLLDAQRFADLRELPLDVLNDIDAIVHLAAISNDPMGNTYERATEAINLEGTIHLARTAKQAGVRRFVFASSCSVYGFAEDGARTEDSSVNPLTAYARSKVASEEELCRLAGPDFIVTCLRFATACGPSPRLRLDLVLNDFVASAVATGKIQILSDGTPWRPLIAVEDMARAIEWALWRTPSNGGEATVVNAGSNQWNYQIHELAGAVASAVANTTVEINKNAAADKRSYRVDFSRFAQLAPQHQPQATLDSVISSLRSQLEAAGFSDPNFRTSEFMRLNMLAKLVAAGDLTSDLRWKTPTQSLVTV
jgi:nucleoside-diphosphate-sugar epimerase